MNAVPVIALDHPVARDATRVGDDAAALATARAAGLPVGRGVVLTPQWCTSDSATIDMLWRIVSHDGAMSLTVRPSLVGSSSLEPARVVHSATDLLAAAREVRMVSGPARRAGAARAADEWRGVLIADGGGTSGMRRRHLVHAAISGGDWIAEVDRAGRVRRVLAGQQLDHPPVEVLARLGRLTDRLEDVLGEAHDVEFAVHAGHVRALHLRSGVSAYLTEYQFETAA